MSAGIYRLTRIIASGDGATLTLVLHGTPGDGKKDEDGFSVTDNAADNASGDGFYRIYFGQYVELGKPKVGFTGDGEFRTVLAEAAKVCEAVEKGNGLLSYGKNNERMLQKKLLARGFERNIVLRAVYYLKSHGMINENDDAVSDAERMMKFRLLGRRRINAELRAKGYGSEAVEAAMNSVRDGDFGSYCYKCLRKKYNPGNLPDRDDRAGYEKIMMYLLRRGYSTDECRYAVSEMYKNI